MSAGDGDDPQDNVIPLPGFRRVPDSAVRGSLRSGRGLTLISQDDGQPRPPDSTRLAAAAEAVLFTAGEPIPIATLRDLLDGPEIDDLEAALALIHARYDRTGHGLRLVEVAGGWQIRTHPHYARWCAKARGVRPLRLSRAALETLSIVAYEQPVTRADVERLRGVDPGAILRMLVERGLVRTQGHRPVPGRPLLYGTTARFLEVFGLRDLSDLPTLRDLREIEEDDPDATIDSGAFEEPPIPHEDLPDELDELAVSGVQFSEE